MGVHTAVGYSQSVSLAPWRDDGSTLPRAQLLHYDDGSTIPVVNFAPDSSFQINLGALSNDEAAHYLDHLAAQARELAAQLRRQAVRQA